MSLSDPLRHDDFEKNSDDNEPYLHKTSPKKEDSGSEGNWLISYADMMTLLMGFFALIASFSKPNQESFEKLKKETAKQFGVEYQSPYENIANKIEKVIQKSNTSNDISIEVNADGIKINLSGTVLFNSGEFNIRNESTTLIKDIGQVIYQDEAMLSVMVEGHTDNRPISQGIIASNWELSGLRAARVAQVLEGLGFSKNRITIIGWGDTKPLFPNENDQGIVDLPAQAKNRRVVIKAYKP